MAISRAGPLARVRVFPEAKPENFPTQTLLLMQVRWRTRSYFPKQNLKIFLAGPTRHNAAAWLNKVYTISKIKARLKFAPGA